MKKLLTIILTSCSLASCVDTVILPDNKTVEEDFWQKKSEVQQMVNGAYVAMASEGVQRNLIVWSSRSDELNMNTAVTDNALSQIYTANIQTTNSYADWSAFYSVINKCNLVIAKSEGVMSVDPNYQQGDHNNNVAQMKALRALTYFYLIRTFHDVPLVLEPYTENSQDMNVAQVAPAVVLEQIISDLEDARYKTLSSQNASSGLERVGNFTRDGVLALLADVYLWKASVYNDLQAYNKCIDCCEQIRVNRSAGSNGGGFRGNTVDFDDDGYSLGTYQNYYDIFSNTNNGEVLFSLWYSDNVGLCNMFHMYKNSSNAQPKFYTNDTYGAYGSGKVFADDKDIRGQESVYSYNNVPETGAKIRKNVATEGYNANFTDAKRDYTPYAQNWNVYRVTDVMLMKAEALAQKALLTLKNNESLVASLADATSLSDSIEIAKQIQTVNMTAADCNVKAARMVQIVNQRAHSDEKAQAGIDSTSFRMTAQDITKTADVNSQVNSFRSQMNPSEAKNLELMVLEERARELCFEGKRWYDLMRYNYRHTTGVNYGTTLFNQGGAFAPNYSGMLDLMSRKYSGNTGSGVSSRMVSEPYLYLPIRKKELTNNPLLQQNPVYSDNSDSERN